MTPQQRFIARYISVAALVFSAVIVWNYYVSSLLDRFRAGQIEFLDYWITKYEVTPKIITALNIVLVVCGLVLILIAMRDKYGQETKGT